MCVSSPRRIQKGRFYAKFHANFMLTLRQALYFALFFMGIFMLILKLSSLVWLIISMQYTYSAQLMVYSWKSVQTIVFCTSNCDYDTKPLDTSNEDNERQKGAYIMSFLNKNLGQILSNMRYWVLEYWFLGII